MHHLLLIGCGNMARHGHLPQLLELENLKLAVCCDSVLEKAESIQQEFGFIRASEDYRRELECKDLDLVLVATTWQPRFQIIKDCLLAGKHVLAEKPLTLFPGEIDELMEISRRTGSKLRVGYIQRASAMMTHVRQMIRDGAIGVPKSLSIVHHQRGCREDWPVLRNLLRGGVTPGIDCGIHICDVARWWFDCEPDSVFSFGCRLDDIDSATLTHDCFTMKNGVKVSIEECYSNNTNPYVRIQLLGDRGGIVPVWGRGGQHDHIIHWNGVDYVENKIEFPTGGKATGNQMRNFLTEIERNADLIPHLLDVRKSTEMALGGLLASARGERVNFPLPPADIAACQTLITRD